MVLSKTYVNILMTRIAKCCLEQNIPFTTTRNYYKSIEISQLKKYEQNADLLVSLCKSNDLYTVPCAANNQLIAVT